MNINSTGVLCVKSEINSIKIQLTSNRSAGLYIFWCAICTLCGTVCPIGDTDADWSGPINAGTKLPCPKYGE